jgi:hypothetical protein
MFLEEEEDAIYAVMNGRDSELKRSIMQLIFDSCKTSMDTQTTKTRIKDFYGADCLKDQEIVKGTPTPTTDILGGKAGLDGQGVNESDIAVMDDQYDNPLERLTKCLIDDTQGLLDENATRTDRT